MSKSYSNNPSPQINTETEERKPPELMALADYFSRTFPSCLDNEGVDEAYDRTEINWLKVQCNELGKAITEYISFKPRVNNYNRIQLDLDARCILRCFDHKTTFFIVNSRESLPKDNTTFERMRRLAIENSIGIVEEISKGIYHDFVEEKYYCVSVGETWPGSADDAATYGEYNIHEITKEHALKR